MTVRAKFRLVRTEYSAGLRHVVHPNGIIVGEPKELRTLAFSPVHPTNLDLENFIFWDHTPVGEITLGVVNPEAWAQFELGKEYYIDFTEAPA